MEAETLRAHLEALATVLARHGDNGPANEIQAALDGSDEDLRAFLISNELWGGPGSIADQAGMSRGRDARRSIEAVLLKLGERQMRDGIVNVRTGMWVDAFSSWQREGI